MPNSIVSSDRSISIITAVGRKEPDYLRLAGNSIVELSKELAGWKMQWLLAVDGIDMQWVYTVIGDLNIDKQIIDYRATDIKHGPAFPRNRALKRANTEWLFNLDADDEYIPNAMAELLSTAHQKDAVWAMGGCTIVDSDGNFIRNAPVFSFHDTIPIGGIRNCKIEHNRFPSHCSAFVGRTNIIKEIGGWVEDPLLAKYEDIAMWTKINARYAGVFLPSPVLRYRRHQTQFTHQSYWSSMPDRFEFLIDDYLRT